MAPNQPIDDPVRERHGIATAMPVSGAAPAHGERKGNGQDSHNDRDEGIGQLVPESDAQAHGVKAALAQIADVAFKLTEVHLLRLQALLLEVGRFFVNLGKRCVFELLVIESGSRRRNPAPSHSERPMSWCRRSRTRGRQRCAE